jgi:peroxiredoxin
MAENPELSIGSKAIDFSLKDSKGNEVTLSSFRGKTNIYLFFIREYN